MAQRVYFCVRIEFLGGFSTNLPEFVADTHVTFKEAAGAIEAICMSRKEANAWFRTKEWLVIEGWKKWSIYHGGNFERSCESKERAEESIAWCKRHHRSLAYMVKSFKIG